MPSSLYSKEKRLKNKHKDAEIFRIDFLEEISGTTNLNVSLQLTNHAHIQSYFLSFYYVEKPFLLLHEDREQWAEI